MENILDNKNDVHVGTILDSVNQMRERVHRLQKQIMIMTLPRMENKNMPDPGREELAKHDTFHKFDDFQYLESRVIYHYFNYADACKSALRQIEKMPFDFHNGISFTIPSNCSYEMAFAFEGIVSAFGITMETPVVEEVKRGLSSKIFNDFPRRQIQRDNVDGLYWRINVLRNRAVHFDEPRYHNADSNAQRWLGLSSKPLMAEIKDGKLSLQCTLFDIAENQLIKDMISNEIINKKTYVQGFGGNVIDLLFPEKSPKGYGKKAPNLLMYGDQLKRFDYFRSFWTLSDEMLSYLEKVNHLFMRYALENLSKRADIKEMTGHQFQYDNSGSYSIRDVYNLRSSTLQ
ncbi:MAG: hypothetical protein LBO70_02555 [Clostridiales Family XIII bacterium]|jgi:hypothetical protein|nr:hypothetical protein [Clostridiales Family XIII bacterium]